MARHHFQRPDSAQNKLNIANQAGCSVEDYSPYIIQKAGPITSILPVDLGATAQTYTAVEPDAPTVVCSGTVQLIGSKYCILTSDSEVTVDFAPYCYQGKFVFMAEAAATFAQGATCYIETTTLLVSDTSGAGYEAIGIMLEDVTSEKTNTLPSANSEQYFLVDLNR